MVTARAQPPTSARSRQRASRFTRHTCGPETVPLRLPPRSYRGLRVHASLHRMDIFLGGSERDSRFNLGISGARGYALLY